MKFAACAGGHAPTNIVSVFIAMNQRTITFLLLLITCPAWAQDEGLKDALEVEARQVAMIERLAPAVAAVFPKEVGQGGGSGVIIDPRGYVLTNFHVSQLNKVLSIGLSDGKIYRARLLGFDPGGDIALLKLETKDTPYPFVPLGRSDSLKIGEPVFAMGNPFLLAEDFTPTVTQGVVAGIHRYRDASGSTDLLYGDCIQIDASINPGNSGGPLFSGEGKLIGINGLGGFRPDRGRVNVGVGFAASIDQIKNFLFDLRACLQCYHGTMNATVRDEVSEDGGETRLVVDAVMSDSSAFKAGLRLGDEVKRFDGVLVRTQNALLTLVSRLPTRRRVTLSVEREREDKKGVHKLELTFRLEPLWAGPEQGKWQPDPKQVEEETLAILARYRLNKPPTEWVREETVDLGGGMSELRITRVRGRQIRVELGPPGVQTIEVYDGKTGWRQLPDGKVERLAPDRRDALAGTVEALAALAAPSGEKNLNYLRLVGGERIAGELVFKLEARDRAGRKRLLYISPKSYALVGTAYPVGDDRWIEETLRSPDGKIRRVDFETGALLEEAHSIRVMAKPQDPALFVHPNKGSGQ